MPQLGRNDVLIAVLIMAAGVAACGYFISQTMYNSRVGINTAEVKGLAERRVEADRAYWSIQYTVTGGEQGDVPALYEQSKANLEEITRLLLDSGFEQQEITPGVIDYVHQEFRGEDQKLVEEKYQLVGTIEIETGNIHLLSRVRSRLNELIARGIDINNNAPSYYFSRLNDIKPEMLQEATRNARAAANEFAANAGVNVGGIREARQGGFEIRDVGENYGDTRKIEKDVRVVTTISFYLTR